MSDTQSSPPRFNVYGANAAGSPAPYAINTQVMVGAIVLLFIVIFIVLTIHVYVRWFLRRSSVYAMTRGVAPSAQHHTGLDKAVIAQLPTFVYTLPSPALDKSEDESAATPATECAVCLSEFQENEKVRMLPACKHMFHTECIDMWFFSHSTCPLCRTDVVPATAASTESTSESTSTDQQQQEQEAMGPSQGTVGGDAVTSRTARYPNNGQLQVVIALQGASTSVSLPMSPSLRMPSGRALPQITIDIPPISEGNVFVSASGSLSAKQEQGAGSSQPPKSPSLRASLKRILSRQSSRHNSPRQEGYEEFSPK